MNSDKSAYLTGVASHGLGRLVSQAAPIGLMMIFSRRVSTEELGVFGYVISLISISSVLSDLGLSDSQNRFLGAEKHFLSPIINWEMLLSFCLGLALFIADLLTHCFSGLGLYLMLATFASSFNVLSAAFSGQLQLIESGIYQFIASGFFIGGTLLLYSLSFGAVEALLLARIGSWSLLNLWMLGRLIFTGKYQWHFNLPRRVWAFALNTFWFSSVELLITQADVLIVKFQLGDRAVAVFKSASVLGVAPMVLGTLLAAPLLSILSREIRVRPLQVWRNVRNLAFAISAALSGVLLIVVLKRETILQVFYTPLIAHEGASVFSIMFVSTCLYVVGMPLQEYLLAADDAKFVRQTASWRLVLFSLAVFPSLRYWGIVGISLAHLLVYGSGLLAYIIRFRWKLRISGLKGDLR